MRYRLTAPACMALLVAGCTATPAASGSASSVPASTPAATRAPSGDDGPSPSPSPSPTPTPTPSAEPLAWTELETTGAAPTAREDHTWTADAAGDTAYLFGGRDGAKVFGDLWAFDLATDAWTELAPPAGPAPRFGHEAVWVEGAGLIVFAGQAGASFFNDLWAYDPGANAWQQLPSGGAVPVARYGTCAAIGPDGRLWISHGFTAEQARFSDTRAYDFGTGAWTDETPDGDVPVRRCLHDCWWTDTGALTLYAGQTTGVTALGDRWVLADGAWSQLTGSLPPERNLYARARLDGATLVFGGQALDQSYLGDLWLLRDGEADAEALESEDVGPTGRAGAELVRDAGRDRILLFGGRGADDTYADLWRLTGVTGEGG